MKKNKLQLLCSSLLLVSSGTVSQTTVKTTEPYAQAFSQNQSTTHRFEQYADSINTDETIGHNKLLLATAEIYTDNDNAGRLDDIITEHNDEQPGAGTASSQAD